MGEPLDLQKLIEDMTIDLYELDRLQDQELELQAIFGLRRPQTTCHR